MRLSLALPQDLSRGGPALLVEVARRAEATGFDGLWTLDSGVGGATARVPHLDPLVALSYAAAVTTRVELGVAVIVASRRNPVQLAKDAASVDVLSQGRLVLGLGVGNDPPESARLGFAVDDRGRRLSETVEVLRTLWADQEATHHGRHVDFSDVPMQPKPVRGTVPIHLGAGRPAALRRVARIGDGWIGSGSSALADLPRQLRDLSAAMHEQGRDPAGFPMARRVYVAVGRSRAEATAALTPRLDGMYGAPGLTERSGVCGTPAEVAETLTGLVDAGLTELVLNPLHDPVGQLDLLLEVKDLLTGRARPRPR